MPVLIDHRVGEPCWVDLMSSEVEGARDFYTGLLGWTADTAGPEYGGYITFSKDGHTVAGLSGPMGGDATNAWLSYLKVEDADAAQQSAADHGAQVLAPPMTVGEQGRVAVIADPSGAVVGLWQSLAHPGYELVAEVGAVVWTELSTRDYDAAVAFYTDVFGWHPEVLSDTPEFRYVTFGPGGGPGGMVGGVYDAAAALPPGVPSHWQVYFGVDDVDAGVSRVGELGGSVLREAWDSEFGRFAQVADPAGAAFLLSTVES